MTGERRRTGDVLDMIDGAIRDYGLSGDAMRWCPDPAGAAPLPDPHPVLAWLAGLVREMRRVLCPDPDPDLGTVVPRAVIPPIRMELGNVRWARPNPFLKGPAGGPGRWESL